MPETLVTIAVRSAGRALDTMPYNVPTVAG